MFHKIAFLLTIFQEAVTTEEIKLYFCGREKCAPSHSFGPAVRSAYLLHYIINGKGKFTVRSKTYALGAGEYFLIKPDEITYYEADAHSPWEYAWISFSGERAEKILSELGLISVPVKKAEDPAEFAARITQLVEIYEDSPQNTLEQLRCVYGIFAQMANGASSESLKDGYIKKAVRFIRHNFAFDIKISDIANHVGIDRTYLYKLFVRETGLSPKEYLTDYRLKKAKQMLSETDMSVSQVAASCGYPELPPFSRTFKQKFGVAPSEFKNL